MTDGGFDTSLLGGPGQDFSLFPQPSSSLSLWNGQTPITVASASTSNALTAPQPTPAVTPPAQTPAQTTVPQYTPAEIAGAKARGMVDANGMPLFAPGTVAFNSQGVPYNPREVGANAPQTGPGSAGGKWDWGADAAQHYEPYWPSGQQQQPTTAQPATPTTNQLTSPPPAGQQPAGPLVSHLQLLPQPQPDSLQYQPQQQPPPGRQPTEVGQADPDAARYVHGTNIPIAVAKQFIRGYEPGPMGYRAAWGVKGGLPENVATDETGFPTAQAYPGAPIGGAYGGAYAQGTMSHAAGMYQVEPATWKTAVEGLAKEGVTIKDFSPQSQEQVASWLLENQGMQPWAGVGPSGVPFNANLKSAWEEYQKTGQMPKLTAPADYAGFHGGGPIYAGDTSGGYGVGGALAFAPRGPTGGPAQSPEANPNAAGGPGGAPQVQLTPAERAFQQMTKGQQSMRGYQMLALLAAMGKGHPVTSGYNPANAMPHLALHETPMGGGAGWSPVGSVQTPGVQTLRRSYSV